VIHKIEDMFFRFGKPWHIFLVLLLLPFSFLYCTVGILKKLLAKAHDFEIPVISIGNLTVGGSGKTPFSIELCKHFEKPCVVLRGYGRDSKGLIVVSKFGELRCDVLQSGDEAMLIAKKAPNASVIVSKSRKKAVIVAKKLGCEVVLLDDGFGKFELEKFDILLKPQIQFKNIFCLPSGPFRFPLFFEKFADAVAIEGIDFKRVVNLPQEGNYVLVTAIANPKRLDAFLPQGVEHKYYFADHHYFTKKEIDEIISKHQGATILCTEKDGVKLEALGVRYAAIGLSLGIEKSFFAFLSAKLKDRFPAIALKNQAS
jgi:tetraacyldisaccharide 4'-kinase